MKRRGRKGGSKRTRAEKPLQRRSRHRSERIRILIVCEGRETEPNYFDGLKEEKAVEQKFIIEVKKGRGGSCRAVVRQAIAEREKAASRWKEFDEVWCVLDVEQAGQREHVIEARTLAGQHDIQLALSNPSFEVWLLAHFDSTRRFFADCDKVSEHLNKHWRREFEQDYEKNDERLYTRLAGLTRTAIGKARKVRKEDWDPAADIVDCNSATDVYRLVERLLGPPE
jgi:hypothetical protein